MVLNKRILRNIKKNFFRWFSLFVLIVLGMFMVVSLITSAEIVTKGVEEYSVEQNLEDGEFSVFAPLTDENIRYLSDEGFIVEQNFYIDFAMNDNSTVRVFKNRESINLQSANKGTIANHNDQIMIEQHYAKQHDLQIGDTIIIAGIDFEIVGFGTSPDYDNCKQNVSDVGTNHKVFGTAFVTDEAYNDLKATDKYKNTEEYLYSYKLNEGAEDDKLKEILQDLEFDTDSITDEYVRGLVDEFQNKRDDIVNNVNDLKDASCELEDGLKELSDGTDELSGGMETYKEQSEQLFNGINEIILSLEELSYTNSSVSVLSESVNKASDGISELYKGAKEISDNTDKLYSGSTEFTEAIDTFAEEIIDLVDEEYNLDIDNLTMFLTAEDNLRIKASIDDVAVNKSSGIIGGIIVLILFTYVISVFIAHEINDESAIIGALYSMGVRKRTLLLHYVALPVVITFVGGILGTILAFTPLGIDTMISSTISYYSLPKLEYIYPIHIMVYGIVLPPLIAIIVNTIVINGKLSQTPLSLLRKQSKNKVPTVNIKTNKMNFTNQFRIRQFIRELRTSITMFIGMLISLVFLMLGITCFCAIDNFQQQNKEDLNYSYLYSLKYELDKEDIPDDAEKCYVESVNREIAGYDMEVTLMGIEQDSKYFDFDLPDKKNSIVVGSSAASKFGLNVGDTVTFNDKLNDRIYSFEVADVVQYSIGLHIFMDADRMRSLYDRDEGYFNVLLSDTELNIDTNMVYSITRDIDILNFAEVFKENMNGIIYMMLVVSVVVFIVVIYLMINIMLDKSANNISLMKIFGYNDSELKRLYLDGNFFVIAISALINVPLSKICMNAIWPSMVANMQCGFDISLPSYVYFAVFALIFLCYFAVSLLLMRKVRKISPAIILKNRE